jgi:hypothetical protein
LTKNHAKQDQSKAANRKRAPGWNLRASAQLPFLCRGSRDWDTVLGQNGNCSLPVVITHPRPPKNVTVIQQQTGYIDGFTVQVVCNVHPPIGAAQFGNHLGEMYRPIRKLLETAFGDFGDIDSVPRQLLSEITPTAIPYR